MFVVIGKALAQRQVDLAEPWPRRWLGLSSPRQVNLYPVRGIVLDTEDDVVAAHAARDRGHRQTAELVAGGQLHPQLGRQLVTLRDWHQ